jgi:hypothetical protein
LSTLVIRQGEGAGDEYALEGETVIGREHGSADVVLADPGISRRHAAVRAGGGRITVTDLGSSNGTYVNGSRLSGEVELADGDEIQVGGTVLSVHGSGAPATAAHPGPAPAQPRPVRGQPKAAPSRLAPSPNADGDNIPALAAVLCGPLSILLVLFSGGGAFFLALPTGIAAIVLGKIGIRRVDRGQTTKHRSLAHIGRITGIIGTVLSAIAIVAVVLVGALLDAGEDSLSSLIETIREEIEGAG